jgi:LysM repeat protein
MSGRGRHRRQSNSRIPRSISRATLAVTAGGAGLALPLIGTGTAHAASADTQAKPAAKHADAVKKAAAKAAKAETKGLHTVEAGDTLSAISREHDIDGGWKKLYEANRKVVGEDPHLITPGEKLDLDVENATSTPQKPSNLDEEEESAEASTQYPDNLDGWIREAMSIMQAHNIPGSYDGIKRNIMRESGGDPNAQNNWDINAQNGTPSVGLLQTIKPTFDAYHVEGTPNDMTDPVANIVAACNYAADTYGSIDNVNGPY